MSGLGRSLIAYGMAIVSLTLVGCASNGGHDVSPGMFDGPNTVSFKVEGMACRNCAKEIAHELEEVPGVRAAMIDFDTATARVAVDDNPAKAPSMDSLQAAVEKWRREHFSAKEDPQCLDPKRRQEIQQQQIQSSPR